MYIKLTSRLHGRHFNYHRWSYLVPIFTLEQKKNVNKNTHLVLNSILRHRGRRDSSLSAHVLRFFHDNLWDWYLSIRTNRRLEKNEKRTRTAPAAGRRREHGLGLTCRVGRGEQGEARPDISAPRGGPHLDLGRLRLNPWSKSDSWIAEATAPTYLYIFTRGAPPRRANARLGSAHARNTRDVWYWNMYYR